MLTPQEAESHVFPKASFGGYNMLQVDNFLDSLIEDYRTLYQENISLKNKMKVLVDKVEEYRATEDAMRMTLHSAQKMADAMVKEGEAKKQAARLTELGFSSLPICMAKTQYSFSADPAALGAPEGFTIPLREVRLAAGAGFVVAICGDIMTMPGLPREPAALRIGLDAEGQVQGLF